MNQALYITRWY